MSVQIQKDVKLYCNRDFFVDLNLYMILYGWAHVAASMQFKRRECMFGRHLTALLSLFFVSAVHVAVLLACANTVANL